MGDKGTTRVQEKVSHDSPTKTKLRAEDREPPAQPLVHNRKDRMAAVHRTGPGGSSEAAGHML